MCFGLSFPLVLTGLFTAIQANIPVPMFKLAHLTPGITVFGLSFMTLVAAVLISKDRESVLLQRLYTTPITSADFGFWDMLYKSGLVGLLKNLSVPKEMDKAIMGISRVKKIQIIEYTIFIFAVKQKTLQKLMTSMEIFEVPALKGAVFAANIYEKLGFSVIPNGTESRHDIIQAVTFNNPDAMIAFCEGIQAAAPVDSYVTPEPWAMPGYDSDVIMAAGAFVQGSSIELSADGPIKEPYAVYFQGGLTWAHAKLGILMSLQKLYEKGIVKEL